MKKTVKRILLIFNCIFALTFMVAAYTLKQFLGEKKSLQFSNGES